MRKKLVIINSLIVSISLIITMLISVLIVSNENYNSTALEAKRYLNIATSIYDGTNHDKLVNDLKSAFNNIRITVIDLDGNVIIDSNKSSIQESHLNRMEIKNLGVVYKRYSETLKCDMLYVASIDDGNYIRIAIPINSINSVTAKFITVSSITLIFTLSISIFLILFFSKRSVDRLNSEINNLASIADKNDFIEASIDYLPQIIEEIRNLIDDKINKISNQKELINDVLNKMSSGVLVVDKNKRIILINEKALNIFKMDYDNVIDKEFIYLIRDNKLQELITISLEKNEDNETIINNADKFYKVIISNVNSSWIHHGLIIIVRDVTQIVNLDKTKREFFANASHELKSPLTCIIGYQQMITDGIVEDSESIIDYSKLTLKEARRMNDIVVDMLNLSKLERKESIFNENVNIKDVLLDILESLNQKIEEARLKINLDVTNVILNIDKNLAYQLVRNLIDNAIKYNNKDGFINIILNENVFSVKDSGIGIPLNEQSHIFERFYRVDKAKSKALGGTGLGLAIVKHIAYEYGFTISLSSNVGEGTTIEIKFNK